MDQNRRARAAEPAYEPVHPGDVVPMTVAEDDHVDIAGREVKAAHVLDQPVRRATRIEEHVRLAAALVDGHERGEAVLGAQRVVGVAADVQSRREARRGRHRRPLGGTLIREQRVGHVVHERGQP